MNTIKEFSPMLVALALIGVNTFAQEKVDLNNYDFGASTKIKKYRAKIILTNGQKIKATIALLDEYQIELEKVVYRKTNPNQDALPKTIDISYTDIQRIKIKSFGATVGGFFAGTLVGMGAGGLLGLTLDCEDCEPVEKLGIIVLIAGLGGVIGGPVGALDSPFMNFHIAGRYANYEKFKAEIAKKNMRRMKKVKTK